MCNEKTLVFALSIREFKELVGNFSRTKHARPEWSHDDDAVMTLNRGKNGVTMYIMKSEDNWLEDIGAKN
jgi:hypothetical protein